MRFEPIAKQTTEYQMPSGSPHDNDIPDLGDILTWLSNYFKFSSGDIYIKMVKMALSKIQESFTDKHIPRKPILAEQKLAIRYLSRVKEGNLLFHTKYSIIVISFEDFNIHTKSSSIVDCFEKNIKNIHISRF